VAARIGAMCGNAWYEWEGDRPFLNDHPYPDEIDDWPFSTREAWRTAALGAWRERLGEAAKGLVAMAAENRRIGFQRGGTDQQQQRLQRDALVEAGVEPKMIHVAPASGAGTERAALEQVISTVGKGDVLVVWRLDCLGDSLEELNRIAQVLEQKGVGLHSLHEQIDTGGASGQNFYPILGALAGFAFRVVAESSPAANTPVRHTGRKPGRKRKLTDQDLSTARALLGDETITVAEVAKRLGVSPATLYRELPGGRSGVE
jgi:DNA invertase Pin-like site-specific DNA recombinase